MQGQLSKHVFGKVLLLDYILNLVENKASWNISIGLYLWILQVSIASWSSQASLLPTCSCIFETRDYVTVTRPYSFCSGALLYSSPGATSLSLFSAPPPATKLGVQQRILFVRDYHALVSSHFAISFNSALTGCPGMGCSRWGLTNELHYNSINLDFQDMRQSQRLLRYTLTPVSSSACAQFSTLHPTTQTNHSATWRLSPHGPTRCDTRCGGPRLFTTSVHWTTTRRRPASSRGSVDGLEGRI